MVFLGVMQNGNCVEIMNQSGQLGLLEIEALQMVCHQAANTGDVLAVFPEFLHLDLHIGRFALEQFLYRVGHDLFARSFETEPHTACRSDSICAWPPYSWLLEIMISFVVITGSDWMMVQIFPS